MEQLETQCWLNQKVGSIEIPTNIPDGQTPVRGVVTRKKKVIFDEVFLVNNEDLEKEELYIEENQGNIWVYTINPNGSITVIAGIEKNGNRKNIPKEFNFTLKKSNNPSP